MTDEKKFKNPFQPGDLIWFEDLYGPYDFHIVREDRLLKNCQTGLSSKLEDVIRRRAGSSGPYRLTQAENWSGYDFGVR